MRLFGEAHQGFDLQQQFLELTVTKPPKPLPEPSLVNGPKLGDYPQVERSLDHRGFHTVSASIAHRATMADARLASRGT
jgi:hypothetical protein